MRYLALVLLLAVPAGAQSFLTAEQQAAFDGITVKASAAPLSREEARSMVNGLAELESLLNRKARLVLSSPEYKDYDAVSREVDQAFKSKREAYLAESRALNHRLGSVVPFTPTGMRADAVNWKIQELDVAVQLSYTAEENEVAGLLSALQSSAGAMSPGVAIFNEAAVRSVEGFTEVLRTEGSVEKVRDAFGECKSLMMKHYVALWHLTPAAIEHAADRERGILAKIYAIKD